MTDGSANSADDAGADALAFFSLMEAAPLLGPRIRARRLEEKRQELTGRPYPPELARKMLAAYRDRIEHDSLSLAELSEELERYLAECEAQGRDPREELAAILARAEARAMD